MNVFFRSVFQWYSLLSDFSFHSDVEHFQYIHCTYEEFDRYQTKNRILEMKEIYPFEHTRFGSADFSSLRFLKSLDDNNGDISSQTTY